MEELNGEDIVGKSSEFDDEQASTASLKSNSAQEIPDDDEEDNKPIDDDEFNIPPVDFEPSLESILNDIDNHSASDDEGGANVHENPRQSLLSIDQVGIIPEGSDTISIMSRGSADNRSRNSSRSVRTRQQQLPKKKPSSILRHVLLKGMTSSLNSASDKVDAGTATAVTMGNLIAIGTSHGYVLIFDSMQSLKWCLGESQFREEGGSVSALTVSGNGTRLLVGYAKGLILMYDLENGKLIRTLHDAHAPGTAVLILRFTDDPTLALCSDSGGSVFELNFKRTMGVRGCDSRCIFSGSRGEVCTFEPVMLGNYPDNPLKKYVVVALATLSKVLVVILRPKLRVVFTHPLTTDPTTLPIICWQMVIIQTSQNDKIVDPVLTFARDNIVYFYQMTLGPKNSIELLPLQKVTVNYQLLGLHWLNSRTIALLDIRETLHVMDVRSQEELETVDLSQVHLVYASSHFKGLATGGNVSRAFALAGERACYNSVLCFNNQMVLLGTKSVHALTMRSWHERIDYLVKQQFYTEALQLGYELYLEKAKAIIGLKGSKDSKKLIVREKIMYVLDRFVERIPMLTYMEDLNTAKQNYAETVHCAVNYYVLLDNKDPIFDRLYEICTCNPICNIAYLETLEPFILNDQLRAVPPTIVKELFYHFEELGSYQSLEACIVHINVESLDIHQTMKICWTQGLYDAIIYVYNHGMIDYTSPFEELMTELQGALAAESQLTDIQISLGNKILVYASCCLAGRAYPYGNIPETLVEKVQSEIFQCITTLHTRNSSENEVAYPYLRTLLKYDTREFLNVLSLSFEEISFQTELGKRQKQRMVDILLQVMVEQGDYTPTQVGVLFTFLARQMAKSDNSLYVSKLLFEQVLEHLTSAKENNRVDERQQALMELLQAGGMQHFDYQKLLDKCLHAKFYRVCEMLYERNEEYSKIFECYLLDESRQSQVFSYIHKIFCLYPARKEEFQKKVKQHLQELVQIDNKRTAQLVYLHSSVTTPDLVKSLESIPEKQYLFLQGIFAMREQNQSGIHVDTITTEKYIDLTARFSPQLVCSVLKTVESFRSEQAMEICKKYKLIEAIGYLLEKDGKISEAFELMKNQFENKLTKIVEEIDKFPAANSENEAILTSIQWSQLQALFFVIIQFSQRNSPKLVADEREKLWLPLLELVISAYNKFQKREGIASAFNEMAKHLLSSMMGHVSLPTIVEIVMNDPSYNKATFAEVRDLVMGMLETCTYEDMMVNLVKKVTQTDLHGKLATKMKSSRKGFSPRNKICFSCHMPLSQEPDNDDLDIVIYHCGHSYHNACVRQNNLIACSVCQTSKEASTHSPAKDVTFQIPKDKSFRSFYCSDEQDETKQFLSHSEFELKLDASFKLNLKEF